MGNISIPCKFETLKKDLKIYAIFFNESLSPDTFMAFPNTPGERDPNILQLKTSLDNGILYSLNSSSEIEVTYSDYPSVKNRFMTGYDAVGIQGGFYFFLTPMVTFVLLLSEIVREKEKKLRRVSIHN